MRRKLLVGALALVAAAGVGTATVEANAAPKRPVCAYALEKTVQLGSHGDSVKRAQCLLTQAASRTGGQIVQQDGDFGPWTRSAVIAFQGYVGLHQDGVVGPHTWAMLEKYNPDQPQG